LPRDVANHHLTHSIPATLLLPRTVRLLGVGFAVPASYFLARGYINGALGKRLGLIFAMGGAQGLVGWWMVRSGLKVRCL
jgi:heme A synthase